MLKKSYITFTNQSQIKTAIDFNIIVNVHAKTQVCSQILGKKIKRNCSVLDKKNDKSFLKTISKKDPLQFLVSKWNLHVKYYIQEWSYCLELWNKLFLKTFQNDKNKSLTFYIFYLLSVCWTTNPIFMLYYCPYDKEL